ncbi:MAG: NAD(P)-dependent alcohol dehydrogenase [Candidatus Kapabacteria bacterium]|nr:NAD(P)-dependent alcohol dehydrogenase [Candidatus Kapabacteria bacterium]
MKASVYLNYGEPEVLNIAEVTRPIPKHNEVLIRVYASTVTAADIMMRKGKPAIGRLYLGLLKPKRTILGFEFAGEIVEIGNGVTTFAVGDRVFGGTTALGCYAEYVCVSAEDVIATMPDNTTFEEASPVSGSAITVMNFLQGKANIKKTDNVLVYGASGGVGSYAVQIAKWLGAEVTAVCGTSNQAMVKSLGADFVIDYTQEDFTQSGKRYDIIFDTVGKTSFSHCKRSLTSTGIYLSTVLSFPLLLQMLWTALFGGKKAITSSTGMLPAKERLRYLLQIKELLQTGKIVTVIGARYTLSQMPEAHRYVEKGHKKGNLVITIA